MFSTKNGNTRLYIGHHRGYFAEFFGTWNAMSGFWITMELNGTKRNEQKYKKYMIVKRIASQEKVVAVHIVKFIQSTYEGPPYKK